MKWFALIASVVAVLAFSSPAGAWTLTWEKPCKIYRVGAKHQKPQPKHCYLNWNTHTTGLLVGGPR